MGRFNPVASALICGVLLLPATTSAENYAFLVAVGDYDAKHLHRLDYARNDIFALAESLQMAGFDEDYVVVMHDDVARLEDLDYVSDADKIRKQFPLLLSNIQPDDTLIVAFAGHGIQYKGEAESYFCARDADLDDPQRTNLIAISEIYDALKACPARRKLLLVDACRNDPQSRLSRTTSPDILESVTQPQLTPPPEGVVALFSCAEGQEAFEHPDLEHGIFFYHVLQALAGEADDGDNALTLDEFLAYTKRRTATYARLELNASQTPRQRGFFEGEWILREVNTLINSIGMKLVLIPSGEFLMGSTPEQIAGQMQRFKHDWIENEQPQHRVRISEPFYLQATEVTVGQFRQFVSASGYETEAEANSEGGWGWNEDTGRFVESDPRYNWQNTGYPQADNHPVSVVSWNDAQAFCRWLAQREGVAYRLPTEAEWEYACRAGTKTLYSHGDDPEGLAAVANLLDASARARLTNYQNLNYINASDGYVFTAPVAQFQPNMWGLHDMLGNVCEWCLDSYVSGAFASRQGTSVDPIVSAGDGRIVRGGSWFSDAGLTRSAAKLWFGPEERLFDFGFRVAMTP